MYNKRDYYPIDRGVFRDGVDNGVFDADYIALIAILSVALEVYNIEQSERQEKDNIYILHATDKIEEKLEKIEGKLKTIERRLERGELR